MPVYALERKKRVGVGRKGGILSIQLCCQQGTFVVIKCQISILTAHPRYVTSGDFHALTPSFPIQSPEMADSIRRTAPGGTFPVQSSRARRPPLQACCARRRSS